MIRARLSPRRDALLGAIGLLVFFLIWCLLTYGGFVRPLFLPTPTAILDGLAQYVDRGWLFPAILKSFLRVTGSLLLVMLIGIPIGVLMGTFSQADAALRKLVNGAKAVPTTGIMGLVVLWFSIEEKAKIVFLFLGTIFYMIVLVKQAVQAVPEEFIRVARDMGASTSQVMSRVLLPSALPRIWEAIAVCNGIAWTYIVLAEFINSNENQLGLGYLLSIGSRTQSSGKVYGILILIAMISSLTDWCFQVVRQRYLNW
jgi:NitT/TauT family transport system permease protein